MSKKLLLLPILGLLLVAGTVSASHNWSKYHWDLSTEKTTATPLKLGNNLTTPSWNASLSGASADWNSSVLKNQVVAGTSNANCDPTLGQVEVCNSAYGSTGWLGIAQIWLSRRPDYIVMGAIFLYSSFPFFPNDILAVSLGLARYNYAKFVIPLLLGNTVILSLIAFLGAAGIEFFSQG